MKIQSTIVFYKDGDKNIYLFEANDIDAIFRGFKEDAFKDKKISYFQKTLFKTLAKIER